MRKNMAFMLALGFVILTACGDYPESDTESSTTADTIYVMTSAVTSDSVSESIEPESTTVPKGMTAPVMHSTAEMTEPASSTTVPAAVEKSTTTAAAVSVAASEVHGKQSPTHIATSTVVSKTHSTTAVPAVHAPSYTTAAHASGSSGSEETHKTETTAETVTTSAETETVITETETETETVAETGTSRMFGNILVTDYGTDEPRAIEPFSNNNKVSTRYAQTLNHYKESLGNSVNVWNMIVPTSQAFYTPEEYADEYGSQLEEYENVAAHLDGVTSIPLFDTLSSHKDEPIYSRTDFHWQPLGAYYAGEQFAAFAGVPYAPLDTYEKVIREGFVGAFSKVCDVSMLEDYPEEFTYYKPANLSQIDCIYYNTAFSSAREGKLFHEDNSVNASYTVVVGTDECILEMETNVDNSRVLVIFKDSYGNALMPFLTQSFSKVYLCDFRYFKGNALNFIEEVKATDVLFAMSTMAVTTDSKVDMIADDLNLPDEQDS